uniref:Uncharacterized protein n=1 Tax=Panagrellus redivivus TaxID=6233 RepID=A0A7E4W3A3_PANRE
MDRASSLESSNSEDFPYAILNRLDLHSTSPHNQSSTVSTPTPGLPQLSSSAHANEMLFSPPYNQQSLSQPCATNISSFGGSSYPIYSSAENVAYSSSTTSTSASRATRQRDAVFAEIDRYRMSEMYGDYHQSSGSNDGGGSYLE